jgi:hypothetical protein
VNLLFLYMAIKRQLISNLQAKPLYWVIVMQCADTVVNAVLPTLLFPLLHGFPYLLLFIYLR